MLLKLKVKEKEATKNIPPGAAGLLECRGEGAGEKAWGGVAGGGDAGGAGGRGRGRRRVSFYSCPLPPPLLSSPLRGGLALLGARSCKTRAGGGSGAGAPARAGVRPTWSVT